ncbi:MAG: winged helix-turn-helix domain-containing protein [Candidatus Binatia bacterium]|nr:winged helix-turn-helix domain-containing protein [Candidatus Binatia bacterium]
MKEVEILERSSKRRLVVNPGPVRSEKGYAVASEWAQSDHDPGGGFHPQEFYFVAILEVLERKGGRARAGEVLDELEILLSDELGPEDTIVLPSGDIRWRKAANWARFKMVQAGLLSATSPTGVWEITEAGREYLRSRRS